jgi:hypothetical protein
MKITVTRWADRRHPDPRTLAEVKLLFPIPRANLLANLDSGGTVRVRAAAREALQDLANRRFGVNRLKIATTHLTRGSLEIGVVVLMVGSAYAFFKSYEDLRKGVLLFLDDVRAVSRYLKERVQRAYSREEKRVQERGVKGAARADQHRRSAAAAVAQQPPAPGALRAPVRRRGVERT